MRLKISSRERYSLTLAALAILAGVGYALFNPSSPAAGGYRITDNSVYFFDAVVYEADPTSFTSLPYDYAKDERFVYYDGRVVPGADPSSFTVIGPIMAKDENAVYVYDRAESLLDPATVQYLGNYYTKQGDEIHYKGRPTTIDASSIEILPYDFAARDANGTYIAGRAVTDTPPATE